MSVVDTIERELSDGRILTIRAPEESDAMQMLEYLKIVGGETDFLVVDENGVAGLTIEGEAAWIRASREAKNAAMYAGFVDGELVSLCDVTAMSRGTRVMHNAKIALSILKAYWGLHIGSTLMETMLDFARATGEIENVLLDVRDGNERAMRLYERFGFRVAGRLSRYIKIGETYYDMLTMEKTL